MGGLIVGRLALLITPLLSAGCNAILGIDEPSAPAADVGSDARAAGADVRIDVDSGSAVAPEGSTDATGVDVYTPPDRRDMDVNDGGSSRADAGDAREGGNAGADGGDSGPITEDGGAIGGDGGDAGTGIVLLRGTIGTVKLAPAAPGNVRLVDHGIAVPWKSCNATNCVSGGIAP
jgi:hypothetical protein